MVSIPLHVEGKQKRPPVLGGLFESDL